MVRKAQDTVRNWVRSICCGGDVYWKDSNVMRYEEGSNPTDAIIAWNIA